MTLKEFRKLISETKNPKWFNSKEIELRFPSIKYQNTFKGLSSLVSFFYDQQKKYKELNVEPNSHLANSIRYFNSAITTIETFLTDHRDFEDEIILNRNWSQTVLSLNRNGNLSILPTSPEADLILELEKIDSNIGLGAFKYLTNSTDSNFSSFDVLNGYLFAFEFKMQEHRATKHLFLNNKKSLNILKRDIAKFIPEAEHDLNEHIIKTQESVTKYFNEVEAYKNNKEKLFEDWFINAKGTFKTFDDDSNLRIKELEEAYTQKLKLEEPAKYWQERGKDLKKQGNWSLYAIMLIVGLTIGSLAYILVHTPQQLYDSFFGGDKSAAIRWSIIYITILSLVAFVIKQLSKIMFSSYHLARDCQERYTLTYFYLSLLKDSAVAPEQQQLIMQSLFSRADSGLLKDDGSPTMPTDIVQNFYKGKNN